MATDQDVIVVGAGIAGLYAVCRMRERGMRVHGFESAPDVGGTWYHNRYPGARCDVESVDYSYSFSDELQQEWTWTERFATQPEILAYLNHVADRFDLRSAFDFNTKVTAIRREKDVWTVATDTGTSMTARFVIMATGVLSVANRPDFAGAESFAGESYHTGEWPLHEVDFRGKRVGVIGTGSSGIQSVPIIAEDAAELYVFQRSANYSIPAGNRPIGEEEMAEIKATYDERRRLSWRSGGGSPFIAHPKKAMEVDADERRRVYDEWWQRGGVLFSKAFPDQLSDLTANDTAREYAEEKIRAMIDDPTVAELLIPKDHPIGTKRIVTDSGYYSTFNRPNVHLVDVRSHPIERISEQGVVTTEGEYQLDMLIYATGFDAMTGALARIDITGEDGLSFAEAWEAGPQTYLGLMTAGFPNLFMLSGPGSPSVLANMVLMAEMHVNWIADCLDHMDHQGLTTVAADEDAQQEWVAECTRKADGTLFPRANSWYLGANIPGKPRVFMPYIGGFGPYGDIITEVAADGYRGFTFTAAEEVN